MDDVRAGKDEGTRVVSVLPEVSGKVLIIIGSLNCSDEDFDDIVLLKPIEDLPLEICVQH